MKNKSFFFLMINGVIICFSSIGCGNNATAPKTAATADSANAGGHKPPQLAVSVSFGNPPEGGGVCSGKGICDAVAIGQGKANEIADTFQVSDTNSNVLTMRFSMAALQQYQPEQVSFFTAPSHTYQFDGPFNLSVPLFAPLNLAPNAQITLATQSKVMIKGDLITVSFIYSHN